MENFRKNFRKDFSDFKYSKFNPSVNEWLNSIYNFDKNNLNTFSSNKFTTEIINNYFNIKPKNNTNGVSLIKERNKKYSFKRIFVSIPEIKSNLYNNSIFVYVFNKEKLVIKNKIIKLQRIYNNNKMFNFTKKTELLDNLNILSSNVKIFNLKHKNFNVFRFVKMYANTMLNRFNNFKINEEIIKSLHLKIYKELFSVDFRDYFIKLYRIIFKKEINNTIPNYILNKRNLINNNSFYFILNKNKNQNKEQSKYFYIFMKEIITNLQDIANRKYYLLFLYKRYITKIYFNKLKFNYINLFYINKILYKIYNKRVIINIVNLKYLHLDNGLLIKAIVKKLQKKRSKVLRVLRKALIFVKIPKIEPMFLLEKEKDIIEDVKYDLISFNKYMNIKNIYETIFKSLKSIHVIGIRLEGKGRLTRRLTASRALYKKAYLGNLRNVYSSTKGLSALMSRGFRSNLYSAKLNSYKRTGSYGIKSWLNSM